MSGHIGDTRCFLETDNGDTVATFGVAGQGVEPEVHPVGDMAALADRCRDIYKSVFRLHDGLAFREHARVGHCHTRFGRSIGTSSCYAAAFLALDEPTAGASERVPIMGAALSDGRTFSALCRDDLTSAEWLGHPLNKSTCQFIRGRCGKVARRRGSSQ